MSGRKRIVVGDITQGNLKGQALIDALSSSLNQPESGSTYQGNKIK